MGKPLRVAVVGAGAMGANHARVTSADARATLAYVLDSDAARAEALAASFDAQTGESWEQALACDAAIVATPTETHVELGIALLEAGVPVLVEKPLADDLDGAQRLVDTARRCGTVLTCGFVERFNPAVATARSLLTDDPLHIATVRHSPPAARITTGVISDLLIHDLDLVSAFITTDERSIAASGIVRGDRGTIEVVDAVVSYDNAVAALSADRWGQRKLRTVSISTPTTLIELDLLRQDVTVYRHVMHEIAGEVGYRAQTVVDIPFVRTAGEPLALQFAHFLDLVFGEADAQTELEGLLTPHRLAAGVASALDPGTRTA